MAQVVSISAGKLIELLKAASPLGDLQVTVLDRAGLGIGKNPLEPQAIIDLSTEGVRPFSTAPIPKPQVSIPFDPKPMIRHSRASGRYGLNVKGAVTEVSSLKDLLAEGLRATEKHRPGTLEKLALVKPRTKRIVAPDPSLLFDQPELAEKFSEPLMDGWWYGTNNSAQETVTWLRRAAYLASLQWGKDIRVDLDMPESQDATSEAAATAATEATRHELERL